MSMSKDNSTQLWNSVQDSEFSSSYSSCPPLLAFKLLMNAEDDLSAHLKITSILLTPSTPLRNIPLRIYIPASPTSSTPLASIKIVQALIPPRTPNREVQTLGMALNSILPSLFPSRRDAIVAEPVLHGASVPFRAPLEELMREAAYADGWLHLSVLMIDA